MNLKDAIEKKIGTVTAVSIPSEFQFQVNPEIQKPLLQDFVVTSHPVTSDVPLLGKIVRISRFNPLLPEESTLELAKMQIDASFSPLPLQKMEMVAAACQVFGSLDPSGRLRTPGFPVKPGNDVYSPSPKFMGEVLGTEGVSDLLMLGNLRSRSDIPVGARANEVLNKHVAILAMTGAGKTYAASVLLEELMKRGYPLLILDPHGDYTNVDTTKNRKTITYQIGKKTGTYKLSKFQESINIRELGLEGFLEFVEGITDEEVTVAQRGVYKDALLAAEDKKNTISAMFQYLNEVKDSPTKSAVLRQLGRAKSMLADVDSSLSFADVSSALGPGKGVLMDMSGLPAQFQRINCQIVLERLFELRKESVRKSKGGHTPPVFIVVEEAHSFAPAQVEEENFPSRRILRRIATEGRKFGFALCVISQRPSRLDATVLSQCNSQVILRVVNPNDQNYIRQTVESLAENDLRSLQDLSQGEALLSGSMIAIPSLVRIRERISQEGIPAVDRLKEIEEMS